MAPPTERGFDGAAAAFVRGRFIVTRSTALPRGLNVFAGFPNDSLTPYLAASIFRLVEYRCAKGMRVVPEGCILKRLSLCSLG